MTGENKQQYTPTEMDTDLTPHPPSLSLSSRQKLVNGVYHKWVVLLLCCCYFVLLLLLFCLAVVVVNDDDDDEANRGAAVIEM